MCPQLQLQVRLEARAEWRFEPVEPVMLRSHLALAWLNPFLLILQKTPFSHMNLELNVHTTLSVKKVLL